MIGSMTVMGKFFVGFLTFMMVSACGGSEEANFSETNSGWGRWADRWDRHRHPDHSGGMNQGGSASSERDVMAACLAKFPTHPFGAHPSFRTLQPSVNWGTGSRIIHDQVRTDAPALIHIPAIVNVFGNTEVRLENPNGWYCLTAGVNVGDGEINIKLARGAHLADNVDVGVTGNGSTHVRVGSEVNVEVDASGTDIQTRDAVIDL